MYVAPKIQSQFKPAPGQRYFFLGVPTSKTGNLQLGIGSRLWDPNENSAKARAAIGNVFSSFKNAHALRVTILNFLRKNSK